MTSTDRCSRSPNGMERTIEVQPAAADAFEVEDVVDKAGEAIAVSYGHVHHLRGLFGTSFKDAAGDESESGAQGSEGRAQFVADGGDELILHLLKALAFGHVLEGDDDAGGAAAIDERAGYVLNREAGAILAPVDLVTHSDGRVELQAVVDGAIVRGVRTAVGMAMVGQVVHVAAENLIRVVAEHVGGTGIEEGEVAVHIHAIDAVADGFKNGLALAHQGVQLFLGVGLLGNVEAVAEDEGLCIRQMDELVAVGHDAFAAVLAAEIEEALVFLISLDGGQVLLKGGAMLFRDQVNEGLADELFDGVADAVCCVGIEGQDAALHIVGADHGEAALEIAGGSGSRWSAGRSRPRAAR